MALPTAWASQVQPPRGSGAPAAPRAVAWTARRPACPRAVRWRRPCRRPADAELMCFACCASGSETADNSTGDLWGGVDLIRGVGTPGTLTADCA
jgi:hypothetical protein